VVSISTVSEMSDEKLSTLDHNTPNSALPASSKIISSCLKLPVLSAEYTFRHTQLTPYTIHMTVSVVYWPGFLATDTEYVVI
jgi:hypothetical protein